MTTIVAEMTIIQRSFMPGTEQPPPQGSLPDHFPHMRYIFLLRKTHSVGCPSEFTLLQNAPHHTPVLHFAWILAQNHHDMVPALDADARTHLRLCGSASHASSSSAVILTCSLKSAITSESDFPIALGEEDVVEKKGTTGIPDVDVTRLIKQG
ncbi:hypothetical protein BGW80DRAFT_596888, partial [Lactifluus volemus]